MFSIEMLPASYGDCLWIEYGDEKSPRRILIDGGKAGTYASIIKHAKAIKGTCVFELLVVTHIDADHIDGVVKLLNELPENIQINEIWFNGWEQISKRLGGPAGEYLTKAIQNSKIPWNKKFSGRAVVVPEHGPLPKREFADGMVLTILSPTPKILDELVPVWEQECVKAGILPGSAPQKPRRQTTHRLGDEIDVQALATRSFKEDVSPSNGSSIALLAEYGEKSCLLAGDAFPSVLTEAIQQRMKLSRLTVNAFKLPHHGSKNNTSVELAELIRTDKYLISTNGSIYQHPDPEAIARILTSKKTEAGLYFNYANDKRTGGWKDPSLKSDWKYETHFPEVKTEGLKIFL